MYTTLLTIFIPVHNRQYYLTRAIAYYIEFLRSHKIKVIIGDSSKQPWSEKDKYPNLDYIYYGESNNLFKFFDIIHNKINTKYMLMIADDDFVLPNSILSCLDFLEHNNDYSAAYGEFLKFDSLSLKLTNLDYSRLQYYNALSSELPSNSARERILNFFDVENFFMQNHSIVRTSAMKRSVQIQFANNKAMHAYRFSDQQYAFSILIAGKVKALPILYCLRDNDRMLSKNTVPKDLKPELEFSDFIQRFLKSGQEYVNDLAKQDHISKEESSFYFGLAIQKLITGRKYKNRVGRDQYQNFKFPSDTTTNKLEISEIFKIIKKYQYLIPEYSEYKRNQTLRNKITTLLSKIQKRLLRF